VSAARPATATILWRRVDRPGHEWARIAFTSSAWQLEGTAVFVHDARPCRLEYRVRCDAGWRTLAAQVVGQVGDAPIDVAVQVDAAGHWTANGVPCPQVAGCLDVDLNFSPSTNLLPIRRLELPVGESAPVVAAWLRFPEFTLEPLPQVYRRLDAATYRYESAGGRFVRDLAVDDAGFVTHYPDFFVAEAAG
jgi:hypothetical protein